MLRQLASRLLLALRMSFGETVREILAASCGSDLREASATSPLPELSSETVQRTLAANLELAFGIQIVEGDIAHFRTVRDVMQCVRLRAWERRATTEAAHSAPAQPRRDPRPVRPVFVASSRDPRERILRYTPQARLAFAAVPARAK
jgi:acyl carrier protein